MPDTPRDPRAASARPRSRPQTRQAAKPQPKPKKRVRPRSKPGILETARNFSNDMLDNIIPNAGDEIAGVGGGLKSLLTGGSFSEGYDRNRERFLRDQARYDRENPNLSWASTIGGAAAGLVLPAGKAMAAATGAQRAAQGAKWGAGYGALSGAAAGDTASERIAGGAIGAGAGAAVGAVAPIAIDKAVKAAPRVAGVLRDVVADETAEVVVSRGSKAATDKPEGVLKAKHFSKAPDLEETDPTFWGSNHTPGFLPKEERMNIGTAPSRTWFGLAEGDGVTRPYTRESGVGPYEYEADLSELNLLNPATDGLDRFREQIREMPNPNGYREHNGKRFYRTDGLTEELIKDAGYDGYRLTDPSLGDVAAVYRPVPVRRVEQPMEGAPTRIRMGDEVRTFGPYDPLRHSARNYAEAQGIEYNPPTRYAQVDEERAARVAQAYEDMAHNPSDPEVAEAYAALARETQEQYQRLKRDGYQFSFQDPNQDVYPNPWEAIADLRDNRRMQVYPTDAGYGAGGITDDMIAENPLLADTGERWGDQPVRVNDMFRAVHDAYGHAKEGVGFRAAGEENAFRQHLPMFSPAAQRALATETRGQNSWLNFGPHGEANRTAQTGDTVFADQKIGLMPDEFALGGTEDFMPDPRGTAYGYRGNAGGRGDARMWNEEGLRKTLAERGVEVPELTAPAAAPTSAPSPSSGGITAEGVLRSASSKRKPGEGFTEWRAENDSGPGTLFDYSAMDQVPDVPQTPMLRWQPARGPSDRIVSALDNPDVVQGINDYVARGAALGGKDWYNTEPLLRRFQETLGPDDGTAAFGRFTDAVAATSPRSTVQDNIRTASYYHWLRENGMQLPEKPHAGYGSVAQGLHRGNMDKLVNGDGWDLYANPKPASFSTNLQGNYRNVTVDTHNFRLPGILSQDPRFLETSVKAGTKGNRKATAEALAARYPDLPGQAIDDAVKRVPEDGADLATYRPQEWVNEGYLTPEQAAEDPILWSTKPNKNEYGYYEDWQREQAKAMGMAPAQYQASMWVGAGDATGLSSPPEPFLRTLEARVKYTAARLGVDPEAVLQSFIKGETPLLSAGAAIPIAGALRSANLRPEDQ